MSYKLLLADDSVTIQRVIELTFADEDVQVVAVGDGQQAIERIKKDPPDIVLADVGMPERDGFEVATFVKQTPELSHIPVVLLTGAFEPVDQDRVRAIGCDGVLAKPFEPQLLIQRVKELLAMPAAQRNGAVAADLALDDQPLHVPPPPADPLDSLNLSHTEAPPEARAAVDEYFDRLDAAFASIGAPAETAVPPRPAEPVQPAAVAATPAATLPRPPLTGVPPEIAQAFDWLLAAEQGQPVPAGALPGPAAVQSPAMDTIVDEITRRVIERLADRGVRQQVADIVSGIAERLVREEIERLKAGLK